MESFVRNVQNSQEILEADIFISWVWGSVGSGVRLYIEQMVCFGFFTHRFTFNKHLVGYKFKDQSYQSLHRND